MHQNVNRNVTLQPTTDGVLYVWLDSELRSVNVFDSGMLDGLESAVSHIAANENRYSTVIFASRKAGCFFAGADVHSIARLQSAHEVLAVVERGQKLMQCIDDLSVPTIAAIDGMCMGGGLELALACTYRVASNSDATRLSLPEIKLGLLPGWGGTQRLPKKIGVVASLDLILTGRSLRPNKALALGLVDQILDVAPAFQTPWHDQLTTFVDSVVDGRFHPDDRRRDLLARFLNTTRLGRRVAIRAARKKTSKQKQYPALQEAIKAIELSLASDSNSGYEFEREAFARLLFTPTAQSLLGLFVQQDQAKKATTWCEFISPLEVAAIPRKVSVIGAGTMGAGIGILAAKKGMQVVFKELDESALKSGQARVESILDKQLQRTAISAEAHRQCNSRIQFTTKFQDLDDSDIAIEAVLEMNEVKQSVFRNLDHELQRDAILASNTSSLSVTQISTATGSHRRPRIAGLHFFNPVDRMQLVEIVRTEATSEETIHELVQLVRTMGKTPIVTSDKPGFLVNRVLFPYLGEAIHMVQEGFSIPAIDREMRNFGMPMGPLELLDQVGIDIAAHVAQSLLDCLYESEAPAVFLHKMAQAGWLGKKSKCGFYDYNKKRKAPNRQLRTSVAKADKVRVAGDEFLEDGLSPVQRRLVYPILNEAVHCLDEAVVQAPWMVDLAMVLGTGFAPFRGGPLKMIDSIGAKPFKSNLTMLEHMHGARFKAADGLGWMAKRNTKFFSFVSNPPAKENHNEPRYRTHSQL